jgi:GNAT superfamily N-acetyltransferase
MRIIRIEKARQHTGTVARWLYDEWGQHLPDGSISKAEKALSSPPDANGLPVSFLAVDDDEPVGIARLVVDDMETRQNLSPWLASVFVPLQFRGRGIGSRLCERVIEEARRLDFPYIYLFTPDRESFYAQQDWCIFDRTVYRGKDIVIMKKNLGEHGAVASGRGADALQL